MAALGSHANSYNLLSTYQWINDITSYDTWMTEEHPFRDHRRNTEKDAESGSDGIHSPPQNLALITSFRDCFELQAILRDQEGAVKTSVVGKNRPGPTFKHPYKAVN
ncbi:hypothetical protein E5288_WYG010204 [Bos mutus]|uniref:Uncharacterized protein n=1 Tax=Bos mutus TaxID=72004 RepID=A0A6B0RAN8_9CETA|nr:hypothetical protein [Bos mutus]